MIQSVVRALRILETIHSKGTEKGIGLVQIARELDMERSTVYNLVKTLLSQGYVAQDGNGEKYRLGKKLMELTHGESDEFLKELLMPLCLELQQKVGENVSLVAYRSGVLKVICRVLCDNELVVAPNDFKPLYTTISGRCLLAQLDEDRLRNIVGVLGLPGAIWNGISDFNSLILELQRIREKGRLVFESDQRQLGGVGYFILAPEKFAPLALGSAMPLARFKEKHDILIKYFADYSKKISTFLAETNK